ncbi:hypothetical protein BGC_19780 [Burkholderia sp. 3C]
MTAVEVEVDNDATSLFVVVKPVDRDPTLVLVELDNEVIELRVPERPVDSEATLLFVLDSPVDKDPIPAAVEVERPSIAVFAANNCDPLIASVLAAVTRPAATFAIWRSLPGAPTLTTLVGVAPA